MAQRPVTFMRHRGNAKLEVVCPCCGARLKIDLTLGRVVAHESPPTHAKAPDLDHAAEILQKQAARRDALFRSSAEEEKLKPQLLEKKFDEALKKTQGEPVTPPTRDIDLD